MKKQPTPDDIKRQHRALSRLVHPDKNANNPRAADASAALNAAVDVLSDPVKRRLFDLYVQDSESRNDGSSGEAGKSFADWEAETLRPPRWLLRVLSCPGGGVVLAVLSVILLVPALALLLVVALLCLPLRLVLWHCCGVGEPVFQRKGRKREGEEGSRMQEVEGEEKLEEEETSSLEEESEKTERTKNNTFLYPISSPSSTFLSLSLPLPSKMRIANRAPATRRRQCARVDGRASRLGCRRQGEGSFGKRDRRRRSSESKS